MKQAPTPAAALVLALALGGCVADKAGREFRQRLPALVGQPVQILIEELGPANTSDGSGLYGWNSMTIGRVFRTCRIDVATDGNSRIRSANLTGSDYYCGSVIRDLRKMEAHYRRNPGLREREAAQAEARLQELVQRRSRFNEGREDLPSPPVEQPD
jgi:hypothetical protein